MSFMLRESGAALLIVRDTCGNSVTSDPCLVKILTRVNLREQPVARHVCANASGP